MLGPVSTWIGDVYGQANQLGMQPATQVNTALIFYTPWDGKMNNSFQAE